MRRFRLQTAELRYLDTAPTAAKRIETATVDTCDRFLDGRLEMRNIASV
jgi:hypothetical protein